MTTPRLLIRALVLWPVALAPMSATGADPAAQMLEQTGVQGGLIVHVGCGDGRLTAALRANDRYLVQGLDTNPENVLAARRHLGSLGLCGPVSAERFDGKHLPYADNLVNLLVAEELGDVAMDEVLRVLAPRGVAYVGSKKGSELFSAQKTVLTPFSETVKPWPEAIDEWSHFLHDASGNAVARDRVVAAPRRLQWVAGPLWSRSHEYDASLCAMVSSQGRLFYIFDEGPTGIADPRIPDKWVLIARDAFSGVVLWKREVPDFGWKAWKRAELERADWRRTQSQRFRLPVAIPRRLVADGDRVYVTLGYRAPLTALDAATGQTITTYAGTERTDEIVYRDGLLVLCTRTGGEGADKPGAARLVALDPQSGRRLWQTEAGAVVPLSPAMSGPHVFYHDQDAVVCLDAATGELRWRTPAGGAGGSVWNTDTTLVAGEEVVLCATGKQLLAMAAADGKVLWKLPGARGYGIVNPPDLFVADGLVWYGRGDIHAASITGYDPLSGRPARTVDLAGLITRGHHARCYRSKATDNYLLLPKRAVEFVNLKGGLHSRHNWVRGACRYGLLPCNGLLYSTPHPCFCYAGVKLGGFLALSPQAVTLPADEALPRLERGPAHAQLSTLNSPLSTSSDWPMYRHDPKRSGSTPAEVAPQVRPVWTTQLEGKLSQPVVAGSRLFVARVDAGQVCCLDAATGKLVWDYIAGGRVDSAPTFHQGRLIFGSADGWVYCLRASDGALAWRFRAAPDERRVVAFGRVESAWPVHGSVLVHDGVVYCTAGRSSFLDGGITLYGLDVATGEIRCQTRLDGPHPDTGPVDENAYAMEGSKSDVLVTDGERIYLFHNAFDRQLNKLPTPIQGEPGVRNLGVRDFGEHLFSNAGFLDDSGFNRSYWMLGDRWPAFNFAQQSPKAGQLVVFDQQRTYAAKCFVRRNRLSPLHFPATDGYYLVADRNATRPVLVPSDGREGPEFTRWLPQAGDLQTCWNLGVGFARADEPEWVGTLPVRIRAMVATPGALFVAGPPDVCDPKDPSAALEGRTGAVLMAFDPESGEKLHECRLEAPPAFDGLSAAGGRLYMSTIDGRVLCLADVP